MNLWKSFWNDEFGAILSAEAALLGTVGLVGATVGLSAAASSINGELKETAFAIRSLNQSYSFEGQKSEHAWTAGSSYSQPAVEQSHKQLQEQIDRQERELEQQRKDLEKEKPKEEKAERKRRKEAALPVESDWEIDASPAVN